MQWFVVLLLCSHAASAGKHSLKYFYTASSGVPNFPEFVIVGMVDEVQMVHYDSNTKTAVPTQDWMDKASADDPQYWETVTRISMNTQQSYKANIDTAKQRFNQTGGVHVFQNMYGCEWDDETGDTGGYDQYGYDGEDFVALDMKTMTWVAPTPQAVESKLKWDRDRALNEQNKHYYTQECVDLLKKHVDYGKSTLQRTVPPSVSLFQKTSSSQRTSSSPVTCHATGFYPDSVMMFWQRDGQDHHEDVHLGTTLPNHDGTFQIRSTLDVSAEDLEKHSYTCVVQHSSDTKDILKHVKDMEKEGTSTGIIIGVVAGTLVVLVLVLGLLLWKKFRKPSKPDFTRANTDDGSNASSDMPLKTGA